MTDYSSNLVYVDQEAELYRVALELLKLEEGAIGDSGERKRVKITFDVDNSQILINATLDAVVTPTERGAEVTIKPRDIYDSPQPVADEG